MVDRDGAALPMPMRPSQPQPSARPAAVPPSPSNHAALTAITLTCVIMIDRLATCLQCDL